MKELIQELVGLCLKKRIQFDYVETSHDLWVDHGDILIELDCSDCNKELQAAIEKVKAL